MPLVESNKNFKEKGKITINYAIDEIHMNRHEKPNYYSN